MTGLPKETNSDGKQQVSENNKDRRQHQPMDHTNAGKQSQPESKQRPTLGERRHNGDRSAELRPATLCQLGTEGGIGAEKDFSQPKEKIKMVDKQCREQIKGQMGVKTRCP